MTVTAIAANVPPSAGMVVLIGLVVVFSVLLFLTFVFWAFSKLAGNKSENTPKTSTKPVSAPATTPVTDGVPDEVVAVIAAAIAAMSEDGVQYSIRRIRPACTKGTRSAWASTGMVENTRPF